MPLIMIVSFWIGWLYRDRYICRKIQNTADQYLGNSMFLSGDTINHIKCMSILDPSDMETLLENIPTDPLIDDTPIPLPIKRGLYLILSWIMRCRNSKKDYISKIQ